MATPHVAGAWTVARRVSPTATVLQIEQAMDATGKPVTDTFASPPITRDRIRAFSAAAELVHTGFRVTEQWGPAAGLGLVSDGVGLARRTNANHNPTTPAINANLTIQWNSGRRADPPLLRRLPDRRRPRCDLQLQGSQPHRDPDRRVGAIHLLGHQ